MKFIKPSELFLLEEVVKKNFSSKYKDSFIGILWSVLKPLFVMIILTIVFSTLFKRSVENFPVYLLAGKCIFDFFGDAGGMSMSSIAGNKGILQKTAAPKYIFVLGSIISEFLNFLITVVILFVVMIVTRAPFHFTTIPLAVIPIASLLLMITGVSFLLSVSSVYYTDIKHLWRVLLQILLYASAIFYPMAIIPEPYHQYMILNPLYWIIDQFRSFLVYGNIPDLLYIINSILLSSIIFVIGIIVFIKYEDAVIKRL